MNIEMESRWSFFGQWFIASALGFTVAAMLSLPVAWGLGDAVEGALGATAGVLIIGAFFGLLWGAGLGTGQWLVLRNRLSGIKRWAPVTAIAAAVGLGFMMPVAFAFDDAFADPWGPLLMGGTFGQAIGIGQWLLLRGRIPGAGWWIAVNALGLTIALTVGLSLSGEGRELLAVGTAGLITAFTTGLGMLWLLRRSDAALA